MKSNDNTSELVLYKSKDGTIQMDVQLEKETIWLDAHQMATLFGRDRTVILKHLRNVYNTGELDRESTCAKNAQVAADGKVRKMDVFNLDAIISVGYRVNSKRGTEFRIWATNVLKQHIVKGYTVNEKRMKQLKQTLKLASDISKRKALSGDEATILLQTVSEYATALDLLDDYDHQRVAMTLMIAESRPQEKEVIAAMLTNLIGG